MSKGNRIYSQVPERKLQHVLQGHRRNSRFGSGSRSKSEERAQVIVFIGVSKGKVRLGNVNSFMLAGLNNFSRLWAIAMVLAAWYLALG